MLPKLGKRRVNDVQRADIARLITDMANTPAMANKVLSLLSKSFNLAKVWCWRSEATNPCRHTQRFKEDSRERYLSEQELARLGDVLADAERNWGTRWTEVDFERGVDLYGLPAALIHCAEPREANDALD